MKKILISAGEPSGDYYGARLAQQLKKKLGKGVELTGFGGDKMRAAGVDIKIELAKQSIFGFVEVATRFAEIAKTFATAVAVLKREKPDMLVVIDYPGFHLELIKAAKRAGVKKVVYYIPPQVWAWNYKRIHRIKRYVDLVIVKMPFEEAIYRNEGIKVRYFGHPLAQEMAGRYKFTKKTGKGPLVAIFPGSRKKEVGRMLAIMLKAAQLVAAEAKGARFEIVRAGSIDEAGIKKAAASFGGLNVSVVDRDSRIEKPDCVIAKSGTTTLEMALLGIPEVIVYKVLLPEYYVIKYLARAKYIGLPNLILDRPAARELIQQDLTPEKLYNEVMNLVRVKKYSSAMKKDFALVKKMLLKKSTVEKIAAACVSELSK